MSRALTVREVDDDVGPDRRQHRGLERRSEIGAAPAVDLFECAGERIRALDLVIAFDDHYVARGAHRPELGSDLFQLLARHRTASIDHDHHARLAGPACAAGNDSDKVGKSPRRPEVARLNVRRSADERSEHQLPGYGRCAVDRQLRDERPRCRSRTRLVYRVPHPFGKPRHLLWGQRAGRALDGAALTHLRHTWSGRIGDLVPEDGIFRGGRYHRVACEPPHGIDFLNQRDVFSIRPVARRIVQPAVPRAWVFAPSQTLLVGGQGTLGEGEIFGQVALVTPDIRDAGISEHLLRIQARDWSANALLFAYLSTLVGRRLLRSAGVGTKLLSLRHDLVLDLPVPGLGRAQQMLIEKHLEAAVHARVSAAASERQAIRIIEEEVLPAWLG